MWNARIWTRFSKLWWLRIVAEDKGVFFLTGSTMADRNWVVVFVDDTSACRTSFRMSSGTYSGVVVHDPV
jgi:hypothetical protein